MSNPTGYDDDDYPHCKPTERPPEVPARRCPQCGRPADVMTGSCDEYPECAVLFGIGPAPAPDDGQAEGAELAEIRGRDQRWLDVGAPKSGSATACRDRRTLLRVVDELTEDKATAFGDIAILRIENAELRAKLAEAERSLAGELREWRMKLEEIATWANVELPDEATVGGLLGILLSEWSADKRKLAEAEKYSAACVGAISAIHNRAEAAETENAALRKTFAVKTFNHIVAENARLREAIEAQIEWLGTAHPDVADALRAALVKP